MSVLLQQFEREFNVLTHVQTGIILLFSKVLLVCSQKIAHFLFDNEGNLKKTEMYFFVQ